MFTVTETERFIKWFDGLRDQTVQARIAARLRMAEQGNLGDCGSVGDKVSEFRIHFGPGYRVYFVQTGKQIIVLLGGGDKSSQKADIKAAKELAATL